MKNSLLLSLFLSCAAFLNAQNLRSVKVCCETENLDRKNALAGLINYEVEHPGKRSFLKNYYGIDPFNKQSEIAGILKLKPLASIGPVSKLCTHIARIEGSLYTFSIPIGNLSQIIEHPDVFYASISRKAEIQLNAARQDANIEMVHAGNSLPMPYTGKGVLTGLVDIGIDYTHPAFKNDAGDSIRIVKAWAQNLKGGTKPTEFNYGRELNGVDEIKAVAYDSLARKWHGTIVLGSMASGAYGSYGKYKGAAPNSKIIAVTSAQYENSILDGAKYFFKEAEKMQKRGAFNISWGSQIGPHDGTSLFDQAIDSLTNSGAVIVGAVGNWGDDIIHLKHVSTNTALTTSTIALQSDTVNYSIIDVWGKINSSFQIQIKAIDKTTGDVSYTSRQYSTSQQGENMFEIVFGKDTSLFYVINTARDANNKRPNSFIAFLHNHVKTSKNISISITTGANNEVHAWCGQNAGFANRTEKNLVIPNYKSGDNLSTMGEIGGTSKTIITVGGHVAHYPYINWKGENLGITASDSGVITSFSSLGPTLDGRSKPDISAPGDLVIPVSGYTFDPNGSESYRIMPGSPFVSNNRAYYWYNYAATSYAAPIVAGSAALLLEADPTLTQAQIKNAFLKNTTVDRFTGVIPTGGSNVYGYGKLNVHKAISSLGNLTGIADPATNKVGFWSSNPVSNTLTVYLLQTEDKNLSLKVLDMLGGTIAANHLPLVGKEGSFAQFDTSMLKNGQYIGILTSESGLSHTFKITKVE